MAENRKKVAIIGGGITGLSAAYYLQKQCRENNLPIDIYLIEASSRLGGKIQTMRKDGFIIERGPDSFLERKKSMGILATELGIADELVHNATGQSFVLVNDQLHAIPGGSIMGIPTEWKPFVTTGLFSWSGKLRAAGDLVLSRSGIEEDQPLGTFFRRRFGAEVVENLVEPLLAGIYSGDIDKLSLHATFPQFYEVEKKHRSLMLGMKKARPANSTPQAANRKPQGIFQTLKGGLQTIVEALEASLTDVTIIKGTKVQSIAKLPENRLRLSFTTGQALDVDSAIFTLLHHQMAELFEVHGLLSYFEEVPLSSVATVAMAFSKSQVVQEKEGTGFLVSRKSDYAISACTWVNKKWPSTSPDDKVLLRSFVGKSGDESIVELPDHEIEQIVLQDLRKVIAITGEPEFTVVTRYQKAMPQYLVGHKDRVKKATSELAEHFPMIQLAGASFEGSGLPDCIDQAIRAQDKVIQYLKPHLS
ncbi:protoporphyrinogen oxidase [Chryseomicrobium sp. FSL W7-1435]|uniref:protoporphyrinogen oxidase n=1 Tax=Chryseomicrobium sp. FSL W7-1435 TaxID=2921704 RepID=UPI003159CE35